MSTPFTPPTPPVTGWHCYKCDHTWTEHTFFTPLSECTYCGAGPEYLVDFPTPDAEPRSHHPNPRVLTSTWDGGEWGAHISIAEELPDELADHLMKGALKKAHAAMVEARTAAGVPDKVALLCEHRVDRLPDLFTATVTVAAVCRHSRVEWTEMVDLSE